MPTDGAGKPGRPGTADRPLDRYRSLAVQTHPLMLSGAGIFSWVAARGARHADVRHGRRHDGQQDLWKGEVGEKLGSRPREESRPRISGWGLCPRSIPPSPGWEMVGGLCPSGLGLHLVPVRQLFSGGASARPPTRVTGLPVEIRKVPAFLRRSPWGFLLRVDQLRDRVGGVSGIFRNTLSWPLRDRPNT